jgi:SAM-dependent methyltransferase
MSKSRENVERHYSEVARMVREAERDPETGFHIVRESRAACSIDGRSEALNIYEQRLVEGVPEKALVASRGCGDPVSRAALQRGETVLDLGCGGGVDAIIASRMVGEQGKVYGLDMTADMLELARENARVAGVCNIEYVEGFIEDIPLPDASVDVVVSNCVINFSDDRPAVLREAFRVLSPGGRLVVSDIVEFEPVPAAARADLCAIAGTTNGMLGADEYASLLEQVGFARVEIEPKTVYTIAVLREKAERKDRMDHFDRIASADVDSKTGSVIVIAWKP